VKTLKNSRKELHAKMNKTTAQRSESKLQVIHAVPGRVRLRTTDSRLISASDEVAQQLRQIFDGVGEVQTNPTTNSLVVTFDANTVSLPQTLERLQSAGLSETSTQTQPLSEPKLDTFLQDPSELSAQGAKVAKSIVPLVAGLLATGALGIEGWIAFPVYLIAANATRQLIKQIESETQESVPVEISQETATELNGKSATVEGNGKLAALPSEVAYTVVHEIPGRIRFRVPRIAEDAEYAQRLAVLTQTDAKVTDVRVNTAASSIAVSYDVGLIADEKMRSQNMRQARSHLIELIQTANKPNILLDLKAAATQQEPEQESNLWSGFALPALSATLALLGGPFGLPIPPVLIGGTIALAALPVAQRAFDSILNEQRLNIDFLDLAAITITTVQGQFISPAIMILLVEIGEAIREQTAKSSKLQTLDLLASLEQFVWVERNGEKQQISIHEVQKGDTVIVYPGNQIPVDGRIIRGKALIDEQKLTGEAMPVMRHKGQTVYTSTLVREGQLYILTESVGADTRAGQIIKIMQDAPVHDTRIENYAANFADRAVVPTLILSGVVFAFTRNFARAASVLTLDFATGIRVSVPTTVLAALTHAARRGILIRSGRALEKLAQIDAVVFDKTGTLTQGEPVVVSVETVDESISTLHVLELAAAAEQRLTHPVAEVIVRYAEEQGARILPRGKWNYHIGLGVRAQIEGQAVLVGSGRFLRQEGISFDKLQEKQQQLKSGSNSVIYVASNGELLGGIAYRDPLRAESRQVIKALGAEGMDIHLLTGDNKRTAHAVASELGIAPANTHAEAFPEQKVAVVKDLHSQGKTVAFVGDGINDSPALAYAEVSVSFANGSEVARETADVVLMENNLRGLPEAIAIARQALQLIHQNTGIVAIPNLGALVLAVLIGIDPLAATLVNNGSTVVAGINGLRPLLADNEVLNMLAEGLDSSSQEQDTEEVEPASEQQATPETQPNLQQPLEATADNSNSVSSESLNGAGNQWVVNGSHKLKSEPLTTVALKEVEPATNQHSTLEIQPNFQQPLETVTDNSNSVSGESLNGAGNQLTVNGFQKLTSEPLTAVALAHRLNVSATTISRRKSKPDFPKWTCTKDPYGVAWRYSKTSKLFVAGQTTA
jgi:Cu2+-exporting ATPase